MPVFARAWSQIIRSAEFLCIVCILAIAAIVMYEIVVRFAFDAPTVWVQECAVYLLIALAFLGFAPAQQEGEHIRIDVLLKKLPPRVRFVLEVFTCLAIALFAGVATWGGLQMVQQSLRFGRRSLTLLAIPVWIPQLLLPIGMGLLTIGALWTAWRVWTRTGEADRDG